MSISLHAWTAEQFLAFVYGLTGARAQRYQLLPWHTGSVIHPNRILSSRKLQYYVVLQATGSQSTKIDITPFPSILLFEEDDAVAQSTDVTEEKKTRQVCAINGPFESEHDAEIFTKLLNTYPTTSRGVLSKQQKLVDMTRHFGMCLWSRDLNSIGTPSSSKSCTL